MPFNRLFKTRPDLLYPVVYEYHNFFYTRGATTPDENGETWLDPIALKCVYEQFFEELHDYQRRKGPDSGIVEQLHNLIIGKVEDESPLDPLLRSYGISAFDFGVWSSRGLPPDFLVQSSELYKRNRQTYLAGNGDPALPEALDWVLRDLIITFPDLEGTNLI